MSEPSHGPIHMLNLKPEIAELRDELREAINRVLDSGSFIMGDEVRAFEAEVADYLGVRHAIGLNSGTDALVIGLRALRSEERRVGKECGARSATCHMNISMVIVSDLQY